MLDTRSAWLFVAASVALIILPGPDLLFLIAQGARWGRRAGVATALGLACGNLIHSTLAALGLSLLLRSSPWAFMGVKLAGIGYLVYLAFHALKEAINAGATSKVSADDRTIPNGALFRRGVLMNALNPKVALFFLAFLPQFANPADGYVGVQIFFLGLVFTVLVAMIFGTMGWFSGSLGPMIKRRLSRNRILGSLVMAAIYLGLAIRLGMTAQ